MKSLYNLIFGSLLLSTLSLMGQNLTIEGKAPRVVEVGERFQLIYVINEKTDAPQIDIPESLRVIYGPSVSQSTSMQIINGQVSSSFTLTYTYLLVAEKEGIYDIQPASVNYKGKTYTSNAVNIEVVKGSSSVTQNPQAQQQQNQPSARTKPVNGEGDFFVRVLVDKTSVYQGEALVATLKLYTTLELNSFEKVELPKFVGFFKEEIETTTQIQLQRENVNGRIYQTGVIAKYLLFPQRSGTIEIDPMNVEVIVTERTRPIDPFEAFFGGNVRRYKVGNKSPVVTINVKPLPEPKPTDFTGGVGLLRLDASVSKNQLNVNDAINFKIRYSGNGNIKFLDNPTIKFPKEFEVYDPKKDVNVKITQNGATGVILWDYLLIPRAPGKFSIPEIVISYFDLDSKTYKKLSSGPFEVVVEGTAADASGYSSKQSGFYRQNIEDISTDIRFIQTGNLDLHAKGNYFFGTPMFWTLYLLPLVSFVIFWLLRIKQIMDQSDMVKLRTRRASQMSRKRLKAAEKYVKDNKDAQVYDEVLRALWQYLADKLIIEQSRLTRDEILQQLKNRNIDEALIEKVIEVADQCEMARYAPTAMKKPASEVYQQAVDLLVQLEKALK